MADTQDGIKDLKADGPPAGPEAGMASMVGGILDDVQKLVGQHFDLLRSEIAGELRQARTAVAYLGIGSAVTGVGGVFLLLMLVQLLHLQAGLPLWGCFGIVGGALTALGAAFLLYGGKEAADVHLINPPQSAGAMGESLQWARGEGATDNPQPVTTGKT